MDNPIFIILGLHTIAAIIFTGIAIREGEGILACLRRGLLGLATGMLGLATRARVGRQPLGYVQIIQDAIFNLVLEVTAILVASRLIR
jgi:hypothetical protein